VFYPDAASPAKEANANPLPNKTYTHANQPNPRLKNQSRSELPLFGTAALPSTPTLDFGRWTLYPVPT
jgi:hypothetical protein